MSGLLSLQQGVATVANYSIQFRILAVNSGWNDAALRVIFLKGLGDELKDKLVAGADTGPRHAS